MRSTDPTCQRRKPRFIADIPAKVDGETFCFPARITNLSETGLQLECDHQSLQVLMPNIHRSDSHLPIAFHVNFEVPTQTKTHTKIDLICCLVYVRRHSSTSALVGCQFSQFMNESESSLANYLQHFGVLVK